MNSNNFFCAVNKGRDALRSQIPELFIQPVEHLWLPEDSQLCPAVIALSVVKYESPKLGTTGPDRELFTLETESFTINELACFGSLNSMFRKAN